VGRRGWWIRRDNGDDVFRVDLERALRDNPPAA
jgi:hypothetical protein